ncbi:ABC transporter substrate-binding protein [Tissierella pigra]|uniref:Carbohydrate ABC transporter substrate-binding protein n=1 Tax=Tissierella pigra TaxID=2607614 RepID=A0A6N7XRB8_9FIRM|nr:ABC transporter substrate-binding protein [Tissierella pigra]MBU5427548.1 ABC transporter substrate-binding protein [Tissierella pigra]MSU00297.1 carbohydrate ABC transporter substrate-binding protein [Tissierella pigra]
MENKRNKIIILSVILLFIIIVGVFFIIKNKDYNSTESNKYDGNETFGENKNDTEKGGESERFYYVENFIGEEEWNGFYNLLRHDDEIVRIIDGEKLYLREFKTEENIYEIPNKEIISGNGYWIYENVFWNVNYDKESEDVIVSSFDKKGNEKDRIALKDFKGHIYDNSYIYVMEMRVTKNYIYILAGTDTQPILQIFTKTGELKNSYKNTMSFDVDYKERCVYTTTSTEDLPVSGFFMIDSANGDEIFQNTSRKLNPIRFSEDGKLIYGFDEKINVFNSNDGEFIKTAFEFGRDSTYLLDDYYIKDFMVGKNDELYFSLQTEERNNEGLELSDIKLFYYLYTKQEGERPMRETSLTITAPYRNDFIEEAIKRYELKYPREHIEYIYTYNNYDAFLENDQEYGVKLTLDIIAGDIGDIVQTGGSGFDYQDILRTDVFMDLTNLIENDKNYEDLNKDVLNAIKINNTIRALPINYIFYQYELNEDLEKQLGLDIDFNNMSWSQVLDIVKIIEEKAPDTHLFTKNMEGRSPWEVFGNDLLIANMPDLINLETKEVDLNQRWFKDLLIKFKECSESKNLVHTDWEYNLLDNLHGSLLALTVNRDHYYGDMLVHFDEYNKTNKSRMIPNFTGERNDNRIGYSMRMYSINNRSDKKENAWKFLSFLLEEDIQFIASRDRTGMPINKKGVYRMIEDATYYLSGSSVDRYNKATIQNSHRIDYLYNMGYLRFDISNPISFYMNGEMTLDEALKKAEKNVIVRLNE